MELADTSAFHVSRRSDPADPKGHFDEAARRGDIAVCDMVRLELLASARNADDFNELRLGLSRFPDCPIGKSEWNRALDVYGQLAEQGGAHHRSVRHADLLIAAAAESCDVPVLHYDQDFERIAEITGQPTRWLVPRGSI